MTASEVAEQARTARPAAPAPSSCVHCGRDISWVWDNDVDPYGWWMNDRPSEVCGSNSDDTGSGCHRPVGARLDNGWPGQR